MTTLKDRVHVIENEYKNKCAILILAYGTLTYNMLLFVCL